MTEETLKNKFDLTHFMAKEGIAFMKALSKLEERYGVALGEGYNNDLCRDFSVAPEVMK